MLPNEMLLDVYGWFDRRFLETVLRSISRRSDALVRSLAKKRPLLYMNAIHLTCGENFIEFYITDCRDGGWPPVEPVGLPRPPVRTSGLQPFLQTVWEYCEWCCAESSDFPKPFETFDATALPPYLYFDTVIIDESEEANIFNSPYLSVLTEETLKIIAFSVRRKSVKFEFNFKFNLNLFTFRFTGLPRKFCTLKLENRSKTQKLKSIVNWLN